MSDERNIFKIIRNLLVSGTMIGGFICWIFIPNQVAIHYDLTFSPDAYGSKIILLFVFILPLFSLIPLGLPEYHIESEQTKEQLRNKNRANAIIQLILAIILSIIVWIILLKSL
jgi:hypothetical protein